MKQKNTPAPHLSHPSLCLKHIALLFATFCKSFTALCLFCCQNYLFTTPITPTIQTTPITPTIQITPTINNKKNATGQSVRWHNIMF